MTRNNEVVDSPRSQDELTTQLRCITASLPYRHAHTNRVADDHRETANGTVSDIFPLFRIRAWVVVAKCHA